MTAVEYLVEHLTPINWTKEYMKEHYTDIIKEAKKMEREQILRAAYHGANYESSPDKDAEDYYNKTFKSK